MTISDVIQSIAHNEYSLIILTRSDEYERFMNDPIHLKRNEDHSAQMNFAEMIADDVKEGGAYYPYLKDLKVEEVIPFKGDWNEENYALIIDASEEQISSIRQVINDREYTNYGFEMPITMQ